MTVTDERFAKMKPFNAGRVPRIPTGRLPPGPHWPSLLQSIALVRFRHQFVPAMHRRYGDLVPVVLVDGAQHDFYRVDADRLRAALESRRPHRWSRR